MISIKDNCKRKIVFYSALAIVAIVLITILRFSADFQAELVAFAEKIMGRTLDHEIWYERLAGGLTIFMYSLVIAVYAIVVAPFFNVNQKAAKDADNKIWSALTGIASNYHFRIWILYFVLILVFFSQFLHFHMFADYVPGYVNRDAIQFQWNIVKHLPGGRLISYLMQVFFAFLEFFGVNFYNNAWVIILLGMIVYAIDATIIFEEFSKITNAPKYFVFACVLLGFVNPLMGETYIFYAIDWSVGVLFVALALKSVLNDGEFLKKYLLTLLWLLLAIFTYQTNIFIAAVLLSVGVLLKNSTKSFMELIKEEGLLMVLCVIAALVEILVVRLGVQLVGAIADAKNPTAFQGEGIAKFIKDNIIFVYERYINVCGYMPRYFTYTVLAVVLLMLAISLRYNQELLKKLYIILFLIALLFVPFGYRLVSGYGAPARMTYSVFMAVGMIIIVCMECSKLKLSRYLIGVALIVFLAVTLIRTESFVSDVGSVSALDRRYAEEINSCIVDYEINSGKKINTIVSVDDWGNNVSWPQRYINDSDGYTNKIMYCCWARAEYINYVNGTNYKDELVSREEWDDICFDAEFDESIVGKHLYFVGDKVYWNVY